MYKIYIEGKVVLFSDAAPEDKSEPLLEIDPQDGLSLTKLLQNLQFTKRLTIISEHTEDIFQKLLASSRLIEAAGGLVTDPQGNILMIFRNGRWDLPKGKMEPGEIPSESALREVAEECSVGSMTLGNFICHTFHAYRLEGEWVLKRTWWYRMSAPAGIIPVPQAEEGITRAEWIAPEGIANALDNTYGNIRDVFAAAGITEKTNKPQ